MGRQIEHSPGNSVENDIYVVSHILKRKHETPLHYKFLKMGCFLQQENSEKNPSEKLSLQ